MNESKNGWVDAAQGSRLFKDGVLVAEVWSNFWGTRWCWLYGTVTQYEPTREAAKAAVEKEVAK